MLRFGDFPGMTIQEEKITRGGYPEQQKDQIYNRTNNEIVLVIWKGQSK